MYVCSACARSCASQPHAPLKAASSSQAVAPKLARFPYDAANAKCKMQMKVPQTRINTVLLNSTDWSNTGGLPGFLLTKAAASSAHNTFIAPGKDPAKVAAGKPDRPTVVIGAGIESYLEATRSYVSGKHLNTLVSPVPSDSPRRMLTSPEVIIYSIPHTLAGSKTDANAAGTGAGAEADGSVSAAGSEPAADAAEEHDGCAGHHHNFINSGIPRKSASPITSQPNISSTSAKDALEGHFFRFGSTKSKRRRKEFVGSSNTVGSMNSTDPVTNVSYVGRLLAPSGKLNAGKAKELGIPCEQLYRFKLGLTYTFDDPEHERFGHVVHPVDVLEKGEPDCVFAVIECPTEELASVITGDASFARLSGGGNLNDLDGLLLRDSSSSGGGGGGAADADVDLNTRVHEGDARFKFIFHKTPHSIVMSDRYKAWMESFGPHCQHVIINEDACMDRLHYVRSSRMQNFLGDRLNLNFFPKLYKADESEHVPVALPEQAVAAEIMKRLYPYPPKRGAERQISHAEKAAIDEQVSVVAATQSNLAATQAAAAAATGGAASSLLDNAEVVFLGTGSSMPGIERNVSGIMLNFGKDAENTLDHNGTVLPQCSMLLDCGEGTYGQLFRLLGPHLKHWLAHKLKAVHISHLHADHHLGLVKILTERKNATSSDEAAANPLLIMGCKHIQDWLADYQTATGAKLHYTFVLNGTLQVGNSNRPEALAALGIAEIESVRVNHCASAVGVVILHSDGWKLVYSGDTRPCKNLINAGAGATLLIHEATFGDDLQDHAEKKKHSTTSEALSVGAEMGASQTILTHFSQRLGFMLPKIDREKYPSAIVAYDLMRIKLSDLPEAGKLYEPMNALLSAKLSDEGLYEHDSQATANDQLFRKSNVHAAKGGPKGVSMKQQLKAERRAAHELKQKNKSKRKAEAEKKWEAKNKKKKLEEAGSAAAPAPAVGDGPTAPAE